MKNKKIIIYVIAGLLALFIILALLGVFCKKTPGTPTDNPSGQNTSSEGMNVTAGEQKVSFFNAIIEQQEFVKANKETSDGVFRATYEEDKLEIRFIDQEGTNDIVKEVPEIKNVKALSGFTDKEQKLRLYALTEDGSFYLLEWTKSTAVKITKYNIPNIESFLALFGDLDGSEAQLFVIVKTTDGKYYSDYKFQGDTERKLQNLVNTEEVVPVENVTEE